MTVPAFIKLPFLRPFYESGSESGVGYPEGGMHLSPGFAVSEFASWLPSDCPFDPQQSEKIAASMRGLDLAELERMRLLAPQSSTGDSLRLHDEMAALAQFGRTGSSSSAAADEGLRLMREQAQKNLIWLWLQEEALAQIADLADDCLLAEELVASSIAGEGSTGGKKKPEKQRVDTSMLPSWKTVLVNAVFLVPAEIPVLAEGDMAEDLLEQLNFQEAEKFLPELAQVENLLAARESAAGILGRNCLRYCGSEAVASVLLRERLWLVGKLA